VCGFTIYGFAPTGFWFLSGLPIMALWALAMPSTQALVTRQVGPEVQGRIQGALTSLASLAGIAGPAIYPFVFGWFISDHAPAPLPGAPFLLAGMMLACAGIVAWRFARTEVRHSREGGNPEGIATAGLPPTRE
jgi:DHA1 family tetracycline resistance protein-like MFS transporter